MFTFRKILSERKWLEKNISRLVGGYVVRYALKRFETELVISMYFCSIQLFYIESFISKWKRLKRCFLFYSPCLLLNTVQETLFANDREMKRF